MNREQEAHNHVQTIHLSDEESKLMFRLSAVSNGGYVTVECLHDINYTLKLERVAVEDTPEAKGATDD